MTTVMRGFRKGIWATYDRVYNETEAFKNKAEALKNVARDPKNITLLEYTQGHTDDGAEHEDE